VPEARLTPGWVEVTLSTHDDGWWVTADDVDLARRVSDVAARRGLRPDPTAVAQLEPAIDTAHASALGAWWAALLTGTVDNVVHGDVLDPDARVPNLWFQATEVHDTPRQRFRVDLRLPHDVADERIAAAVAAGGTVVDDRFAPALVVLADRDGNEACVATIRGR
jgi:4a-hydroxytetrahydrobiopterin dehydratase